MLTPEVDGVDAGLWLSVTALAAEKQVSKQALSKRVARLVEQGVLQTRDGERGVKLINVAAYDRAVGSTVDVVRATNGRAAPPPLAEPVAPGGLVYAREQARRTAYDADLKKLERDEKLGLLLPIDDVVDAMTQCADLMVKELGDLPFRADEIAAAVARDGEAGARRELKRIEEQIREVLAQAMQKVAAAARAAHDRAGADGPDAAMDDPA